LEVESVDGSASFKLHFGIASSVNASVSF
jgi:hypothetical protein